MASKLSKLNERHKAAARLRVEGRNNDFIADHLGVKPETIIRWFSDQTMLRYVDDISTQVEVNFAEKLAGVGMEALEALAGMLKKQDADSTITDFTKLEVIREVMNRIPELATNGQRPPGEGDKTLIFANMPNDELERFLHGGWRDMVPSGDIEQS